MVGYAHLETKLFTVRRVTIPVLPAGSPDLKVLHISDLHLTPNQHRKIAWIRSLAELRPDFVIDTGDNLAHRDSVPVLLDALEPLLADVPGAFVMGSNDYYAPRLKNPARYLLRDARGPLKSVERLPAGALATGFQEAGWLDLTNRRAQANILGIAIDLVGVDDPHLDLDIYPAPVPRTGTLHLGVVHAPYTRVLNHMHADHTDAIIAGHTHGGQLCIPGFGALVTNCDIDRSRAKGLHGWPGARPDRPDGEESTWLHVSAGAGTSPYAPVRFACRPEATLITFTQR